LAFDFGAESGRAILGTISGGRLALEEIHRFPNTPVRLPTGLYWDTLRLFHEIRHGLAICAREKSKELDGIGIDTWGVDFALLGPDGALVDNPRHYRDARTNGMLKRVFEVVRREELFARTGIQFMDINSLCQWYALKLNQSPALRIADKLLFMPDLFSYWLTGVAKCERSIASTSQFYDPRTHTWATDILDRLGLSASILPEIISTGSRLGTLLPEVADFSGLAAETPVYATAGHDTASAVAAVPASSTSWCYISSGTWSLMGVETDSPVISEDALALNFTNEVGAGGKIRLLKNIAGLWLLQECRRDWALKGREYGYEELTRLAAEAPPSKTILDPDAFLQPGHMPEQIVKYCHDTNQPVPEQPGPMCRTILESLALTYKKVLDMLERLTGRRIETINIVGGGSRNQLLNQLTADTTGRVVIAGPSEATAAGNVLVQAIGSGTISGLEEARDVIRRSFPPQSFSPR
ncbi:MAG: rhamnulokinase, partial [Bryobacteraceae bacterium]